MTTAVVIGHGPSPSGKGWGRQIDAAVTVVRMFNCSWQSAEDYGTKYTAGLITADARSIDWLHRFPVRRPEAWWVYSPQGAVFTMAGDVPQDLITLHDERLDAVVIGAKTTGHTYAFTRGTAAALHAISKNPDRLVLVGMDEVAAGQFSATAYSDHCHADMARNSDLRVNEPRPGGQVRSDCHDLSIEMAIIRAAAERNGLTVQTAEEAFY